jgi:hypothetical protein
MRGTRRPILHEKLRSEGGIKVTGGLGVILSGRAFVATQGVSRKKFGDQEATLFVSTSITWTKDGLVPTDTIG